MFELGIIDTTLLVLSLGILAGLIGEYIHQLIDLIPGVKRPLARRLLSLLIPVVVGWVVWFIVAGPQGSVIICILVIIWAMVTEQIRYSTRRG